MTNTSYIAMSSVFVVGTFLATQGPINAGFARHLDNNTMVASFLSFVVGTLVLGTICLIRAQWPHFSSLMSSSWWMWLGGVLGASVVVAMAWSVPQIGVVTAISCFVLGQMTVALLLDATGAFSLPVHPVSVYRVAALFMVGGGLWLSRF